MNERREFFAHSNTSPASAIEPRGADHFKGIGTAAQGKLSLPTSDTGIESCLGQAAHVRRRIDPHQPRSTNHIARPSFPIDYLQVGADMASSL